MCTALIRTVRLSFGARRRVWGTSEEVFCHRNFSMKNTGAVHQHIDPFALLRVWDTLVWIIRVFSTQPSTRLRFVGVRCLVGFVAGVTAV